MLNYKLHRRSSQQGFCIVQFKEVFFYSSFLMSKLKYCQTNDIQHSYRNTVQINKWPSTSLDASQRVAPEYAKPPGSHLIAPCNHIALVLP